jgi:hypothetical protein
MWQRVHTVLMSCGVCVGVLCVQGVGGISDIITTTGDMNVDFADIKAVRVLFLALAAFNRLVGPHFVVPTSCTCTLNCLGPA